MTYVSTFNSSNPALSNYDAFKVGLSENNGRKTFGNNVTTHSRVIKIIKMATDAHIKEYRLAPLLEPQQFDHGFHTLKRNDKS